MPAVTPFRPASFAAPNAKQKIYYYFGLNKSKKYKECCNEKISTNFHLTENPISENGNWINGKKDGIDWADVVTVDGRAGGIGGDIKFSDPTTLLTGSWGRINQLKQLCFPESHEKYCQEVEIRLRSAMAPHFCSGYEILFRCLKQNGDTWKWCGGRGPWLNSPTFCSEKDRSSGDEWRYRESDDCRKYHQCFRQ